MIDRPWQAPSGVATPAEHGLGVSGSYLKYRLGASRRALEIELASVTSQLTVLRGLDDAELDAALAEMRAEARLGRLKPAVSNRARALALLAIAAERSLQWCPRAQQLRAALAMHDGFLVELATGEGKTLAVALAAILNAWRGRACHVATANDYLARRDAELMRPLYRRCGLEVAAIAQATPPEGLLAAYRADVVYAVGKQFLVDFLRDQLMLGGADDALRMRLRRLSPDARGSKTVMRGLDCLIVDDAETVMLDDAIAPVVVSVPSDNPMLLDAVRGAQAMLEQLCAGRDYRFQAAQRDIEFTQEGDQRLERFNTLLPPLWRAAPRRDDLIRMAIVVRDKLQPQQHYVIQQGRVVIIDDHIGRLLARPAWMQGLHQAIELKEGLEPTPPSRVLARMGFLPFFRRYRQLAGVGTGVFAERGELWRSLRLMCLRLPAETASARKVKPPAIWPDQAGKQTALIDDALKLHRRGMPVLINLRRLSDAEAIARRLGVERVACQMFNPRQLAGLEEILSRIGQPGQITLSLNTDLCGADLPVPALSETEDGGLHILQCETQELSRQDQRILHLAGRHGEAAVVQQYLALDDALLRFYLPACCAAFLGFFGRHAQGKLHWVVYRLFKLAQQRANNQARRLRQQQPRREDQLNQQLAFAGEQDMDVGIKQFGTFQKD